MATSLKIHLVVKPEFAENALQAQTFTLRHKELVTYGLQLDPTVSRKGMLLTGCEELPVLADFALTQPHEVYSALVHGVIVNIVPPDIIH